MSELQLKGWLVNALQGTWIDVISPGAGSTFGYPDLGMLVPGTSLYMPIELKLAEVKATSKRVVKKGVFFRDVAHPDGDYRYETIPAENRVRPSRLRPSQVAWHDGFTRAGGYSRLVLAVFSANGWDVWVIDRPRQERLPRPGRPI